MRNRGGTTWKAASPLHLGLPASPTSPRRWRPPGPPSAPQPGQTPPSLWLLLLFYMYLVSRPEETTLFPDYSHAFREHASSTPLPLPVEVLSGPQGPSPMPGSSSSLSEATQPDAISSSPKPCRRLKVLYV